MLGGVPHCVCYRPLPIHVCAMCFIAQSKVAAFCVFVPKRSVYTVDGTIFKALNCGVSSERLRVHHMCIIQPPIRRSNGLNVAPFGTYLFVFILDFGPKTIYTYCGSYQIISALLLRKKTGIFNVVASCQSTERKTFSIFNLVRGFNARLPMIVMSGAWRGDFS